MTDNRWPSGGPTVSSLLDNFLLDLRKTFIAYTTNVEDLIRMGYEDKIKLLAIADEEIERLKDVIKELRQKIFELESELEGKDDHHPQAKDSWPL